MALVVGCDHTNHDWPFLRKQAILPRSPVSSHVQVVSPRVRAGVQRAEFGVNPCDDLIDA